MKKNEALKFLKKLKKAFGTDLEAHAAIDILVNRSNGLDDTEESPKLLTIDNSSDELVLPSELFSAGKGYALFADGACRGNPGPGSYAVIIQNSQGEVVLKSTGIEVPTTNNKMEMQGIIRGLQGLFEKFLEDGYSQTDLPLFVYSDSKYVIDGITTWVPGWKARGWKKADNKAPENLDLWKELDSLKSGFEDIKFIWVKGHAGHPQNELCDQMANTALDEAGF